MTSVPGHRPIPGFRPSTPTVTAATIDHALGTHRVVVIHFWAEWNGVDVPMDQCIQEICGHFDAILFVSCNVDSPENTALCKRCKVANIPFLAVFVAGEQRCGIMGLRTTDELKTELEKHSNEADTKRRWWHFRPRT